MQQHDHRPVSRTFIDHIEDKLTATVLIHAPRMPHRMSDALGLVGISRTRVAQRWMRDLG
jgi:hypothetical protein